MKRQLQLVSVLMLAAVAMLVLSGCAAPAQAQDGAGDEPRTIVVTGTGTAYGSPDVATAQIGVQTRNADPAQAVADNNERMEDLIAALRGLGIAERDIQTTNFSVYTQQDYDPRTGQPSEVVTYVVDNTVNVTVRDVNRLGDVLSGAAEAGANSIFGVSFSVADPSALEAEAREAAMADARARAEDLARIAGVTLDVPLTISETRYGGQPIPLARDVAQGIGGAAVPVQTGQIQVNLMVNVTYSIR